MNEERLRLRMVGTSSALRKGLEEGVPTQQLIDWLQKQALGHQQRLREIKNSDAAD